MKCVLTSLRFFSKKVGHPRGVLQTIICYAYTSPGRPRRLKLLRLDDYYDYEKVCCLPGGPFQRGLPEKQDPLQKLHHIISILLLYNNEKMSDTAGYLQDPSISSSNFSKFKILKKYLFSLNLQAKIKTQALPCTFFV